MDLLYFFHQTNPIKSSNSSIFLNLLIAVIWRATPSYLHISKDYRWLMRKGLSGEGVTECFNYEGLNELCITEDYRARVPLSHK